MDLHHKDQAGTARPGDGPRSIALRGRSLVVTDDKPSFWDKAADGSWEPELLDALERALSPGDAMLDIGAWVGPTSLFAAQLGAEVVSVEADPRAATLLRGNIAANPALAGRMRVIARAASPNAGTLRLGAPRKPGDSMSSALHAGLANAWEVETVTPWELVETALRAASSSLVVKVDIEGGEYELLPPLAAALPDGRTRALIVAFHPGLLREAGRSEIAIEDATRLCFEALAGWNAALLDIAGDEPAHAAAARANCTVLFTPSP